MNALMTSGSHDRSVAHMPNSDDSIFPKKSPSETWRRSRGTGSPGRENRPSPGSKRRRPGSRCLGRSSNHRPSRFYRNWLLGQKHNQSLYQALGF